LDEIYPSIFRSAMRFSLLFLLHFFLFSSEPACQRTQEDHAGSLKSILLNEFTRGTDRSIRVTPTQTTVRINDTEETDPTPAETWQSLTQQVAGLPVADLSKIPVLSKKHQVDAALHATLTIAAGDSTYTSDTFDHNAPPEQLRTLVDSLYRRVPASLRERFQQ
jgi:hypothetical protein